MKQASVAFILLGTVTLKIIAVIPEVRGSRVCLNITLFANNALLI